MHMQSDAADEPAQQVLVTMHIRVAVRHLARSHCFAASPSLLQRSGSWARARGQQLEPLRRSGEGRAGRGPGEYLWMATVLTER